MLVCFYFEIVFRHLSALSNCLLHFNALHAGKIFQQAVFEIFFSFFFTENRFDNLNEMSKPIFYREIIKMSVICCLLI